MSFTRGPWFLYENIDPQSFALYSQEPNGAIGPVICWFGANRSGAENLGNAQAMLRLPELITALETITNEYAGIMSTFEDSVENIPIIKAARALLTLVKEEPVR